MESMKLWWDKLGADLQAGIGSAQGWAPLGIAALIGFLLGIFSKHFLRFLVIAALVVGLGVWLLGSLHVITVDYARICAYAGLNGSCTASDIASAAGMWARDHIRWVVAGLVGFIIGRLIG